MPCNSAFRESTREDAMSDAVAEAGASLNEARPRLAPDKALQQEPLAPLALAGRPRRKTRAADRRERRQRQENEDLSSTLVSMQLNIQGLLLEQQAIIDGIAGTTTETGAVSCRGARRSGAVDGSTDGNDVAARNPTEDPAASVPSKAAPLGAEEQAALRHIAHARPCRLALQQTSAEKEAQLLVSGWLPTWQHDERPWVRWDEEESPEMAKLQKRSDSHSLRSFHGGKDRKGFPAMI